MATRCDQGNDGYDRGHNAQRGGVVLGTASDPQFFAEHRATSLLQRLIEPEEVANLVAFVASPLSSAVNGAALRVDGGVTPTIA